jgi:KipI family sensor histidine kinase inhibitor
MIENISNLGDAAIYCDFGKDVNEKINSNVISYCNHLKKLIRENKIEGITNLTPSYNKLIISFDLSITNFKKITKILENLKVINNNRQDSKKIKIPLCCDEEYALDLISLSKKLNISKNVIIDLHLNKEYYCYMTGFIAGMPFLGDIHESIRVDRLQTPRVKVPKGSIGITEQFCNIYTFESPGGWNIIGNTPLKVFDKLNLNSPSLIKPGDRVSFYKITKQEYLNWNE